MDKAAVDAFRRDGFLAIPQLADAATVEAIGAVYDDMLAGAIDVRPTDNPLGGITRQIMIPSAYHPLFRDNPALDAAREIAALLLGVPEPKPVFDMLIYKEPGQTAETPWHQDFSYSRMPHAPAGAEIPADEVVQFWLALDDVDEENGCMHFVPGAHRSPMLPHFVASGAPDYSQRLLAIRDAASAFDLTKAVACPLKAGGATVHNYGTPHFTSGNRTVDRRRRAYIFNFTSRPRSP
ncbi:MAG TPA: phytanoyl-CoA dioxygenase family protein [Caulobacteraceae bacterium]|nr:phytanoyl-CoA dioxygenase family protein [Caulobacteraceae bacterium]